MLDLLLRFRLLVFLAGLLTFFVSERYLALEKYYLYTLIAGALLIVVAAVLPILGFLKARRGGQAGEATSWVYVIAWQWVFVLGLALYLVYSKLLGTAVMPEDATTKALLAGWLLLLNFGFFAGVGIELSHRGGGSGLRAEPGRVKRAGLSWLMVGMALAFLTCFNYVGARKDKSFDWSYLKSTTPGEATVKMFQAAKDPVTVAVFYPSDNEVRPFVVEYFDFLKAAAKNVTVEFFDKDLHPTKAEQLKVSRNGQVIISMGEKQERLDVGLELRSARSTLKKLDSEVQKNFLRLSEERRTLYFSRGHGELAWSGGEPQPLKSLELLEKYLRSQNYNLKTFGVGEGASMAVPEDAAAVVIVGPESPFLGEEVEALRSYLNRGGSLLVMLDLDKPARSLPGAGDDKDPLLKLLAEAGLKYTRKVLANDKNYVSATRSPSDKWFLFSNTFSSHESVASLAKHDERIALIMFQSGFYDVEPVAGKWKGAVTLRSLTDTFVDENRNFAFDTGKETRKSYALGAAATMVIDDGTTPAPASPTPAPADPHGHAPVAAPAPGAKTAKILAVADANFVSDMLIRNPANAVFLSDGIKWLTGRESFAGETTSEEDVKIQHSRKEDVLWFNGTVLAMPALVLLVGFFATRTKRRRK